MNTGTIIIWGQRIFFVAVFIVLLVIIVKIICLVLARRERAKISGLKNSFKRSKASGVIFGKNKFRLTYSPESIEGHCAVFGGTGSGKTSALLIPTLRKWRGTALVVDISGDISLNAETPSKLLLAPQNANTSHYSPFYSVDMAADDEERKERLQQLSFILIADSPQDGDVTAFYKGEARKMLQAALIAYYFAGLDFVDICKQIVGSSFELLIEDISASGNELAERLISGFIGVNEKTLAATKQEVDKAILLFATNENVARCVRRSSDEKQVNPATLEKNSVYIVIDDVKLELYAPLLRLITAQTLEYLATRPNKSKPPILLCFRRVRKSWENGYSPRAPQVTEKECANNDVYAITSRP